MAFEKIYAPFDGVVTARNTDIGQLIDSGPLPPQPTVNCSTSLRLTSCVSLLTCRSFTRTK